MAQTAELKVLSSNAFKEAYLELVPGFEKATEHKVVTTWAGTNDIIKRMQAGETYDLVIMAGPALDNLIKQGKIVPGSRVDLVKSGVGVAVRAGAPKPDISSGEALKRTLLAAKSVGYSSGPERRLYRGPVSAHGHCRCAQAEKQADPARHSGRRVDRARRSRDRLPADQRAACRLPASTISARSRRTFSTSPCSRPASIAGAKETEAAKALVKFLTAPAAVPVIKQKGLEPG